MVLTLVDVYQTEVFACILGCLNTPNEVCISNMYDNGIMGIMYLQE